MPNRDQFGNRIGSQSARINAALINGHRGTATEIANIIGEPAANVSSQLSWLFGRGLIQRSHNYRGRGGRWVYFYQGAPVRITVALGGPEVI